MLNTKKSQAALEFLMTYGWAILVVLIVISALAYFGVLNPQRMLPSRCTMPTGFSCMDYVAHQSTDDVVLKVVNGMGSAIIIDDLDLTSTGTHPSCTSAAVTVVLSNNFKCGSLRHFSYKIRSNIAGDRCGFHTQFSKRISSMMPPSRASVSRALPRLPL